MTRFAHVMQSHTAILTVQYENLCILSSSTRKLMRTEKPHFDYTRFKCDAELTVKLNGYGLLRLSATKAKEYFFPKHTECQEKVYHSNSAFLSISTWGAPLGRSLIGMNCDLGPVV